MHERLGTQGSLFGASAPVGDAELAERPPSLDLEAPRGLEFHFDLHLPDIIHINFEQPQAAHFRVSLTPAAWTLNRDQNYWIQCAWPDIREEILRSAGHLDIPVHTLRALPEDADPALRLIATALASNGALHARAFTVDIILGATQSRRFCVDIRGHVPKFVDLVPDLSTRLEENLNIPVDLFTRGIEDVVRKSYLTTAFREQPRFRPPSFFAAMDDPRPKLIQDPLDFTALTFWAYDGELTRRPEDAQACFATALGGYVLNVVPLSLWGNSFSTHADTCQVFFVGGIPQADGSILRARVGRALIRKPHNIRDGAEVPEALVAAWEAHQRTLEQMMTPWIREHSYPEAKVVFKRAMDGAIQLGQTALVQCLQRSNAPFYVRALYNAHEPGVRRSTDITPGESVIDLKPRQRLGPRNQEQLMRCLLRQSLLSGSRFRD